MVAKKILRYCIKITLVIKTKINFLKKSKQDKPQKPVKPKISYRYTLFILQNELSNLGNSLFYNVKNYIEDLKFLFEEIKKEYLDEDVFTSMANKRLNESFLEKLKDKRSEIKNLRRKEQYKWLKERAIKQRELQEKFFQKQSKE